MILCPMKDRRRSYQLSETICTIIRVSVENADFAVIGDFYSCNSTNSDDEFYKIISKGITRPKVFVKRNPSENGHNPFV